MPILNSCIIAFAMYSKLPMPRVDWNETNMKYVMAFFPWVGIAMGLVQIAGFYLLEQLTVGPMFRGAILAALPILITGGIHMDGFMDTMDARGSWGDMERKLEILKDSHTGAFAILGCVVYYVTSAAVWSEMTRDGILLISCAFFFSRCLSGLGVTVFRCARNSGLAHTFHSAAQKKIVRNALLLELAVSMGVMLLVDATHAIPAILVGFLTFGYYRWFSYKDFGGITGDLAGYFLQLCELFMAAAVVILLHIAG